MAVAEKSTASISQANPLQQLAISSLLGGLYLFLSIGFIFSGLPILWNDVLGLGDPKVFNPYLSTSLLLLLAGLAGVGLIYLGMRLESNHHRKGLRAGSVFIAVTLFIGMLAGLWLANGLVANVGSSGSLILGAILTVGLVAGVLYLIMQPGFAKNLAGIEDQGWFSVENYKKTQGTKVRRGTLIAFLVIVATGIYSAVDSRLFGVGDWLIRLPGMGRYLCMLFHIEYTLPLILFGLGIWLAMRAINVPLFADFLIATEAEMNKVSWTTRKRLIQDTIVVLVTVVLFTLFLFIVDIVWIRLLSAPIPGVLKINPKEIMAKQNAPTDW